ncbi:MAG: hypothetical protein DMG65_07765 [Candidatus Angelobacter sp. Gp1-AA117]|nr:MAG: hypothetical protein DMG65_07765 [Candidatus Angelobacter sp. Gp1-AA117]
MKQQTVNWIKSLLRGRINFIKLCRNSSASFAGYPKNHTVRALNGILRTIQMNGAIAVAKRQQPASAVQGGRGGYLIEFAR